MRNSQMVATALAGALLATAAPLMAEAAPHPAAEEAVSSPGHPPTTVRPAKKGQDDGWERAKTRTPRSTGAAGQISGAPSTESARSYLGANRGRFAIEPKDLKTTGTHRVAGSDVVAERFVQTVGGVPVFGSGYVVRMKPSAGGSTVLGTSGTYYSDLRVSTVPELTPAQVDRAVRQQLADRRVQQVGLYVGETVVVPTGTGVLAYRVEVTGRGPGQENPTAMTALIDARTGRIVTMWEARQTAESDPVRTTGTTQAGRTVPLALTRNAAGGYDFLDRSQPMFAAAKGEIRTYDAKGADASKYTRTLPADAVLASTATIPASAASTALGAVDAQHGMAAVYEFYRSKFGRNSIDDKGMSLVSVVNVTEGGKPFQNAFWDGSKMVFGGASPGRRPYVAALDVVAHEMTHGVTEHSAKLIYRGQSGAINEAHSDYFGNAIQNDAEQIPMTDPRASLVGESLCTDRPAKECAIRDLADGSTTYRNFQGLFTDHGGVHVNATIYGNALWNLRKTLDKDLADKLVYTTLTQYLTPDVDFVRGKELTLIAALDMGLELKTLQRIERAFTDAGITDGWEDRIGMDSRTVARGMQGWVAGFMIFLPQPVIAGDAWITTEFREEMGVGTTLIMGSLKGGDAPVRLTRDEGVWHEFPRTDANSVVWKSNDPKTGLRRIYRADVRTRVIEAVFEGTESATGPVVSGRRVAWTVPPTDNAPAQVVTRLGDGPLQRITLPAGAWPHDLSLRGDDLGMVTTTENPQGGGTRVVSLTNLVTGKRRDLATLSFPVENGRVDSHLVLTGKYAFYTADTDANSRHSIVKVDQGGWGASTTLVDEKAPNAPVNPWIDASDTALTYLSWEGIFAVDQAKNPKLMQIPLDGSRAIRRVSCNRGAQGHFSMDSRMGVLWLDATRGTPALEYREAPAGDCPATR